VSQIGLILQSTVVFYNMEREHMAVCRVS